MLVQTPILVLRLFSFCHKPCSKANDPCPVMVLDAVVGVVSLPPDVTPPTMTISKLPAVGVNEPLVMLLDVAVSVADDFSDGVLSAINNPYDGFGIRMVKAVNVKVFPLVTLCDEERAPAASNLSPTVSARHQ